MSNPYQDKTNRLWRAIEHATLTDVGSLSHTRGIGDVRGIYWSAVMASRAEDAAGGSPVLTLLTSFVQHAVDKGAVSEDDVQACPPWDMQPSYEEAFLGNQYLAYIQGIEMRNPKEDEEGARKFWSKIGDIANEHMHLVTDTGAYVMADGREFVWMLLQDLEHSDLPGDERDGGSTAADCLAGIVTAAINSGEIGEAGPVYYPYGTPLTDEERAMASNAMQAISSPTRMAPTAEG